MNKLLGALCIVIGFGLGSVGVYGFVAQGRGAEALWLIVPCLITFVIGCVLVSDDGGHS